MRTSAYYTFIMPAWFTKRYKVDTYIPWIITKFVPKNVFIYNKISFLTTKFFPVKEIHHTPEKPVHYYNPMSPSLFAKKIEQVIALKVVYSINNICIVLKWKQQSK